MSFLMSWKIVSTDERLGGLGLRKLDVLNEAHFGIACLMFSCEGNFLLKRALDGK